MWTISTLALAVVIGLALWTVAESIVGFTSGGHLDVTEQFRVTLPSGPRTDQSKIVAATVSLRHPSSEQRIVALVRDLAPLVLAFLGLLTWKRLENAAASLASNIDMAARYLRMLAVVIGLGIPIEVSLAHGLNESLVPATGVPQQAIVADHDLVWPVVGLLVYALSRRLSRSPEHSHKDL